MKKKALYILIINYVALISCILITITKNLSFKEFINRFLILLISINTALYIFLNLIFKNIYKVESTNNIDIVIPPIESELKDILNEFNENIEDENEEFKELNFKDLNE